MTDGGVVMQFFSGLPMEEISDHPDPDAGMDVYEIKYMCFIGMHEYSQIEHFFGTYEEAQAYAEATASEYWNGWDNCTYWDEGEQAWMADDPLRGVRISSVVKLDGITCETATGVKRLVQFCK